MEGLVHVDAPERPRDVDRRRADGEQERKQRAVGREDAEFGDGRPHEARGDGDEAQQDLRRRQVGLDGVCGVLEQAVGDARAWRLAGCPVVVHVVDDLLSAGALDGFNPEVAVLWEPVVELGP